MKKTINQPKKVSEDMNNMTTADYRIYLRIDWENQAKKIIKFQEKLLD